MSSHARQYRRTETLQQSKACLCTAYLHNATDKVLSLRATSHERSFYKSKLLQQLQIAYSSCNWILSDST